MDQPRLRIFKGDGAFARAKDAATDEQQVCGTYVARKPVYFLLPADASDDEVEAAAFFVREGREIGPERQLMAMADRLRSQGQAVPDWRVPA
jgi:TPP-dependent 2-oxoacid decarboxylase